MKKQQNPAKPFFSVFLESQMERGSETNLQGGDNPNVTMKHPSDAEDDYTKKYPTDSDEVTLAYPSDSDHDGPPQES